MPEKPSWKNISAVFDGAIDRPAKERAEWAERQCQGDTALYQEVEKLLVAHERAEGVLELPMMQLASEALRDAQQPASGDEQVGPYRIVSEIGHGGMGVVYKAEDLRLGRFVALKFLPPHMMANERAKQRFLAEARAASALDHPNICTIHDIGQTPGGRLYFAMAYYDGQTLADRVAKGPLPIDEVLGIAIEVSRSLSHAHAAGVIHRDIKPANILLTSNGQVKVLDFGLAKRNLSPASDPDTRVGTVTYMSPEQAGGGKVDVRTDLWSLGVTLYETIVGRPPFRGEYTEAIIYSILNENPESITGLRTGVPIEVERIVDKSLEKQCDNRYQHADDLVVDLQRIQSAVESGSARISGATAMPRSLPSIAVLPFANMNRDAENEFFAEGIAEDITRALTKIEGLSVAAHNSALQFKGETPELQDVGQRLGVDNVLVGSVRRAGNRVRVTVRLSNVASGYDVWSDRYDRVMDDVFQIQDDISNAVAETLKGQVALRPARGPSEARGGTTVRDTSVRGGLGTGEQRKTHPKTGATRLDVRFCTRQDGVRIAYATVGNGPLHVLPPGWISHLEESWASQSQRAFYEALAHGRTLVMYDKHGTGLSNRDREDFSLGAEVRDLETVIDHLAFERVALVGVSQGGPVAAAYAAGHPDRVSRLIVYGGYADGEAIATLDMRESILGLIRAHWGIASKALADIFMPGADAADSESFARLQRASATSEMACELLGLAYRIDVRSMLPRLRVPTLVIHREKDRAIPFRLGREVANLVPDARFVSLPGKVHFPWLEDSEAIVRAMDDFLAEEPPGQGAKSTRQITSRSEVGRAEAAGAAPPSEGGQPLSLRNFPSYVTSFVGREGEVRAIATAFETTRLLTLTGPGGTGKTRLSQRVAIELANGFRDGAFFVGLASVTSPDLVPSTMVRALNLADLPGTSAINSLKRGIEDKNLLLVIDNFAQVLEAATVVDELLVSCREIKILVTSRAPLRVAGEQEFRVPALQLPRRPKDVTVDSAERHSAVKLFADRAREARPGFVLTGSNAADIAQLCSRLDGLPLAIELAAARVKLFSPDELLARLAKRLDLLAGGQKERPERHRTLREAIAWSYDLFEPPGQCLFRRLSVFAGGWTLDAAEAMCAGDPELESKVLDLLTALTEHSLVRHSLIKGNETRFLMLETIRDYGREQLAQAGEEEAAFRAHADHFVTLAEQAESKLTGAEQGRWLDRLELENANFRTALQWAGQSGNAALAVRFGTALWRFWIARGHLAEGLPVYEKAVAGLSSDTPVETRVQALNGLGTLYHSSGRVTKARQVLKQCVALARDHGSKRDMAKALTNLAWVDSELSDYGSARALSHEALRLHEESQDKRGAALALNNIGWVHNYRGNYRKGRSYHEQSLALRREIGDQRGIAFALSNLAWAEQYHGDLDRADLLLDQAMEILRPLNDGVLIVLASLNRARVARDRGHLDQAVRILEESLARWSAGTHPTLICWAHTYLGAVFHEMGEPERGDAYFDQGLRGWKASHCPWGVAVNLYEQGMAAIRRAGSADANGETQLRQSLKIRGEIGVPRGVAQCLEGLALLPVETQTPNRVAVRVAVILAAAASIREELQAPMPGRYRSAVGQVSRSAAVSLGKEKFDTATQRGRKMHIDEAVDFGLETPRG